MSHFTSNLEDHDDFYDEEQLKHDATGISDMIAHCQLPPIYEIQMSEEKVLPLKLQFFKSSDFKLSQKKVYFRLFEDNMLEMYEQSGWGYNESSKREELFHPTSRFLSLLNPETNELAAYVMFRFEWDDEEEPEHPVIYCYELQAHPNYQKKGLGKFLMSLLATIKTKCHMWKILLTCFTFNTQALAFYSTIGFGIDINSPSRCGFTGETYEILSDQPDLQ
jgi:GNAT superfamily N-acetyltransferase